MLDNAKKTLARTTADVLLTRFTPGQRVTHDGHSGTVESVGRFYVSIRDASGKLHRVSPENIEAVSR